MPSEQLQSPPPDLDPNDPLAKLHKMSTTAGLGTTEYVEVNPTAIFAVVMALASALTLFDEPILLLIPVVGVGAAIVAFRQIARSNGTQTGRGIATLALILSFAFGALVFARTILQNRRDAADRAAIEALIVDLGEEVKAGKFEPLYQKFDDRFRERVPLQTFSDTMKFVQNSSMYGKLNRASWKRVADFQTDESTGSRVAAAFFILEFEKAPEVRQQALFRQIEGKWVWEDISSLFPSQRRQ